MASVTLTNKDSKRYELYISHRITATHTSLNGNTTATVCSEKCTIKIKNNGASIKAKNGDKIIIKNGSLKKN